MSSVQQFYPSDVWLPDLIVLCHNFHKRFSALPGGRFLVFHDKFIGTVDKSGKVDKPGIIVKRYHKYVDELKGKMFSPLTNTHNIDYHKIAASYILSFLECRPFRLDIPKETKKPGICWYVMLANEYFSIAFLEAVFKAGNNNFGKKLQIDEHYKKEFIKMLFEHKRNITKLEPLALAHIIYHIEQRYFLP
jgi:hypothetical protein